MEREGETQGRVARETHKREKPERAAQLAQTMRLLPRAKPDIPPEQILEDDPSYRALVRASNQILWFASADGAGLSGMRDWRAFTGQSEAEVAGAGWFNAVHPDDRPRILEQWRRAVETKDIFREEQRIRRHDGVYRDFTVRVVPILGENGELRGWAGASRDVTEQKAALAALRVNEERARASEKRSRAISEVLETALAQLTLHELLPRLLDRVRDALDATSAAILLPDGEGQLRVRATSGFQAHLHTNLTVPLGQGVAGKIAATGKPMIIPDLAQVEVTHEVFQQFLTSLVGVPLRAPNGKRGALHVATATPRDFTADDVRLLEVVAERIADAIERAQLHEATAERAVRLEAIIEAMSDAVLVCDLEGEIVRSNGAAGRLDLAAVLETVEAPSYAPFQALLWRVLRGETVKSAEAVEITIARPDGETVELSVTGSPFWEGEDAGARRLAGGVFAFHDITERRIAERKTADALNAMLSMVERLVAKDEGENERISRTNLTGQRLMEGAATALGKRYVALVKWDEETDLLDSVATTGFSASASAPSWHFPDGQLRLSDFLTAAQMLQVRDGQSVTLEPSILPSQVERAGLGSLLLIPARIRERLMGLMVMEAGRTQEEEQIILAQATARLAALLLERDRLDREREEAESSAQALTLANERLDAFLRMTGHELHTPLTDVKGAIQLTARRLRHEAKQVAALNNQLSLGQQEALDELLRHARAPLARAENASELMQRLVDDTLDAEAIRVGALPMRAEPCDLMAVVRATVGRVRMRFPGREITLASGLASGAEASIPVLGDAHRIMQALTNYLTNALKYAPDEQLILVTVSAPVSSQSSGAEDRSDLADQADLRRDRAMAQVTVRDFGPGLPDSEQERIWDRFARAEAAEKRAVGLGLGLFITRAIIELHDGRAWVESTPGAGCAFSFTLPLYGDASTAPQ
jgi:PAS domain S-box-containing protein